MKKNSIFLTLGLLIITIVSLIMMVNSTYSYMKTKEKIISNMKKSSKTIALSLKNNISNYIASYAVNEYDVLVYNEIKRQDDIFAIVVEDYNMGKILGQMTYTSGKIKDANNNIIDYNPTLKNQTVTLENLFHSDTFDIINDNKKLGTISIYFTDDNLNEELRTIIVDNIKNTIVLSLLLIITLFITIRLFILRPISNIMDSINNTDKDGIPLNLIDTRGFTEINELNNHINNMISSIKQSRVILKNSQNRLEYLLELSPIAVRIAKNKGGDVIFANNAYAKLLRMKKDETIHKNPRDYYAHKEVYDKIVYSLDKNESIDNMLVELDVEGEQIWALASYMKIDFDGEKAIIGWFYDVTNEKNNEKELYEALQLQTTIFDSSGYLFIRTDIDGVIKQMNKEAERLLGYKAEELIDKHTPELIHLKSENLDRAKEFSKELEDDIEPGFEVFIAKSNKGITNEHEWTYVTKDGRHIPVLLAVSALRNSDNEVYGYLGIAKDITQTKLMQSQAKLASMGEMIGNIAHQWRQPLSAISTIASGIRIKSEFGQLNNDDLLVDMDHITDQAQYLSKTIDDFRNFIKNTNKKEPLSVKETVDKAISILKPSLKNHNIELIVEFDDDITIDGYQNQLIQALINIINNAKDAIKENVSNDDDRFIFVRTYKEMNKLILTIKDSGGGIKDDIIANIFEPYFTTKHQSVGTGIGLSIAYQIIRENHEAQITVNNKEYIYNQKEYRGAVFQIGFSLPKSE